MIHLGLIHPSTAATTAAIPSAMLLPKIVLFAAAAAAWSYCEHRYNWRPAWK
jgi:hypothetical protein